MEKINCKFKEVKDEDLHLVTAEVYAPRIADAHGDFMTEEEIRKMAFNFLIEGRTRQVDVSHDNQLYGCFIVESFIAREYDTVFIPGSWVVTVYVPEDELWQRIKNKELNGFSMQVLTYKREVEVQVELPLVLQGKTSEIDSRHVHEYIVIIDKDGNFTGGRTNEVEGHWHQIKKGSVTELSDKHAHKFCFPDAIVELDQQINVED